MPNIPIPAWAIRPTKQLRLLRTVSGDFPFANENVAEARVYGRHEIYLNPHGAVSVLGSDGWLGIKPSEMEWCGDA